MTTFVQLGEQDNAFDLANVLDRVHGRSTSDQQIAAQQREAQYQQLLAEYQQRQQAGEDVSPSDAPSEPEERSELSRLVLSGDFVRLIDDGVLRGVDVIMASSEADIEVVFALTFALFPRLSTAELARITNALLPHLTAAAPSSSPTSPSPFTRLRLLTQLFNLLNSTLGTAQILPNLPLTSTNTLADVGTDLAASVLIATLRFAVQTEQAKQVVASLPVLTTLVTSWELRPVTLSEFHLLAYEVQRQAGGRGEEEQHLFKYLKAVDSVAAETGGEKLVTAARAHAFTAAHRAIASPLSSSAMLPTQQQASSFSSASSTLTPHRLLTLAAVNALATGSADDQSIHTLLRLFATDDVDGYLAFASSHAPFLSSHSLSHPLLLQKLRILSLCALASSTPDNRLAYSVIAERLSLSGDVEVETAVIDAIVSGRLDAKIDQDKAQVAVRRVVGSVLRVRQAAGKGGAVSMEADWASLEKRLGAWKSNMQAVLTKLSGEADAEAEEL